MNKIDLQISCIDGTIYIGNETAKSIAERAVRKGRIKFKPCTSHEIDRVAKEIASERGGDVQKIKENLMRELRY